MSRNIYRRKVIYARRKPGTKNIAFVLLECGHCMEVDRARKLPKHKSCNDCFYSETYDPVKTIDMLFWEDRKILAILKQLKRLFDSGALSPFMEENNEPKTKL